MALGRIKKNSLNPSASHRGTCTVTMTRRFDCPAEQVFDAWLNPAKVGKFLFTTPGGEMTKVEINAIPAGRFLIVERRGGEEVEHVGEYTELSRPSRIAFTFVVPKYSPLSTRVNLEIEPAKNGCELRLTNAGVPEANATKAETGWSGILDSLAAVIRN